MFGSDISQITGKKLRSVNKVNNTTIEEIFNNANIEERCSKYKTKKYVTPNDQNDYALEFEHLKIIDELNSQEEYLQRDLANLQLSTGIGTIQDGEESRSYKEEQYIVKYSLNRSTSRLGHEICHPLDSLTSIWIKFIFPIKVEQQQLFDLFDLRFIFEIGNNEIDSVTIEDILFKTVLFDAEITMDVNSIRIPILFFTSFRRNELLLKSVKWYRLCLYIKSMDKLTTKYENIDIEIEHYGRVYDKNIPEKGSEEYISLLTTKYLIEPQDKSSFRIYQNHVCHFMIAMVKPKNNDFSVEMPIIHTISLGTDRNGYIDWNVGEDLMSFNVCGITIYFICFDPKYKNMDEIRKLFNGDKNDYKYDEDYEFSGINFSRVDPALFLKMDIEYFGKEEDYNIRVAFVQSDIIRFTKGTISKLFTN